MNDADERRTAQCRRVSARDIIGSAPKNGENTGLFSFYVLGTARRHIIDFPLEAASAASVFCRVIDFISYILQNYKNLLNFNYKCDTLDIQKARRES